MPVGSVIETPFAEGRKGSDSPFGPATIGRAVGNSTAENSRVRITAPRFGPRSGWGHHRSGFER